MQAGPYTVLEPLSYRPIHGSGFGESPTMPLCYIVAAVVVLMTVWKMASSDPRRHYYVPEQLAAPVMAFKAVVMGDVPEPSKEKERAKCKAWCKKQVPFDVVFGDDKPLSDSDKAAFTKMAKKMLGQPRTKLVIVFAHWCPHCSSLISELADVPEAKGSVVAINSEAVTPELPKEAVGGHAIEYFPTLFDPKDGTMLDSLEEAKKVLKGAKAQAAEAVSEKMESLGETVDGATDALQEGFQSAVEGGEALAAKAVESMQNTWDSLF